MKELAQNRRSCTRSEILWTKTNYIERRDDMTKYLRQEYPRPNLVRDLLSPLIDLDI